MAERALGNFERHLNPNHFANFAQFAKGVLRSNYCSVYEDFFPSAGATLPAPWTKTIVGAAPPTGDYGANGRNGTYVMSTTGADQLQSVTLSWGDQLTIPATRGWIFECQIAINFAGAAFVALERAVWGLAGVRNATLDNIGNLCWFRNEGASLNILVESDDGTTDTDDRATGLAMVDNTMHKFLIDASDQQMIRTYVDLNAGDGWQESTAAPLTAPLWVITDRLQPFFEIQSDAAAVNAAEVMTIDYCAVAWAR
jgi:hypothetical protein